MWNFIEGNDIRLFRNITSKFDISWLLSISSLFIQEKKLTNNPYRKCSIILISTKTSGQLEVWCYHFWLKFASEMKHLLWRTALGDKLDRISFSSRASKENIIHRQVPINFVKCVIFQILISRVNANYRCPGSAIFNLFNLWNDM